MKKHLIFYKINYKIILFILVSFISCPSYGFDLTVPINSDEIDVWELLLEENICYPNIPVDVSSQVKTKIERQYKSLKKKGFNVKLIRNDEVIKLSIPTDDLFDFNSPNLNESSATKYLNHILEYLKYNNLYRIVIAVHHDDSLSPNEAENLTYERAFKLIDWLQIREKNANPIVPYSMGNDMLLTQDSSKKGKKLNRRLEIYIIPGELMFELAREKKL